ncbi:hypothetical protein SAMN04488128_102595 [Chitinophaga eiseniae]|uniref:Uncharacterized protein n=1 Tax=Chitinophaga eiseniae TaxID=634771 RepID=A0A1T4QU25_9BACT|nr:hypothetical protein [Chitinophaga eiseniae]SKA07240.1 hypothetical protein SAMN04488128_102595 [Chitinophaga eiseniae]
MKTSNKLLLGFLGALVLLMLSTDIILRANYSKGITNVNSGGPRDYGTPTTITLQPFQIVKVETVSGQPRHDTIRSVKVKQIKTMDDTTTATSETTVTSTWPVGFLRIKPDEHYTLTKYGSDSVLVRYAGDTLILTVINSGDLELKAPAIKQIIAPSSHLRINDMKSPSLTVTAGPKAETYFSNSQIGILSFSGGRESNLVIDEATKIDSVNILLARGSRLEFQGSYERGNMQLDSLREINLSQKVLQQIKEIK